MNILVVDDDPVVLESCRRVLGAEGWNVRCVTSAAEALAALGSGDWAVLLADLKMPERDGFQLMTLVRKCRPALPVVAMSGFPTEDTIAASLASGASTFIAKPFTPEELVAAVRRAAAAAGKEGGR